MTSPSSSSSTEVRPTPPLTALARPQETLALVETATGGLVSSTILSLPGTSAVFAGSVVAYQLKAREAWLGWREEQTAGYECVPSRSLERLH